MQYSHISKLFKIISPKDWSGLIKISIFIIACFFIGFFLKKSLYKINEIVELFTIRRESNDWLLLFVFILLPINWGMESLKWQFLVQKNERLSFLSSYRGVLSGITLGFATPNGIGDYAGRLLQLKEKNRFKNLGFLFFNRFAQLHITLIAGSTSILFLFFNAETPDYLYAYLALLFFVIINVSIVGLLFLSSSFFKAFYNFKYTKRFYFYFISLRKINKNDCIRIYVYSSIRYLVFSLQFLLLLIYFHLQSDLLNMAMGIAFVFLVKSILPSFLDLGVREAAAVFYFSETGQWDSAVAASLVLYFINIVIPTILGLFVLPKLKLKLK